MYKTKTIPRTAVQSLKTYTLKPTTSLLCRSFASASTEKGTSSQTSNPEKAAEANAQKIAATQKSTKTSAELDEEIREKMASRAGDGGESGIEYEDGKPAAMKRGVKENMFRYI